MHDQLPNKFLRIAVIGATGAIGKEIVDHLKQDERVSELLLIVRKKLDEWNQEDFKPKLTILTKENFDSFDDIKEQLVGVDAFLCTLGTRVKVGEQLFIKVDYQYPLDFAALAKELGVKHYGLLSSVGANINSAFLYMRTKGRVEAACKELGV